MKSKNLLKILALGAVVISLGACNKKKAKVVELSELLTLDSSDSTKWELEGQLVKVEHLVCQGKHGNVYYGGGAIGDYITDLRAVEIRTKKEPAFVRSGYGADITAEGKVVNVNGRLTLQDAKIKVNSERGEDGKAAEGAGLPVYYCPSSATSRSTWDGYFSGKIYSGIPLDGLFQLASVPEQKAADSGASSYYIAFPGEDLDTSDPDNMSLIKVNVPAFSEMSDKALESYNAFFAEKKVGDFVYINGLLEFDSVENSGMGMIVENYWNQIGYEEVKKEDKPVIYETWAAAAATQAGYYDGGEFLDLAPANAEDPLSAPFSFLVDESYLSDPKGMWTDDYKDKIVLIPNANLKKCASSVVTANFKPAKFEEYTDKVEKTLKDAGYTLDETYADSGLYLFLLKDGSNVVVKEVVMMINNESQVEYQYIAPKASLDYATFAEFKAGLEGLASAKLSSLSGAAATHTSAVIDLPNKPTHYTLTWMKENQGDPYYAEDGAFIRYDVEFPYADAAAAQAALLAYKTALQGAGFVYSNDNAWGLNGLYNATSGEMVSLVIDRDSESGAALPSIVGYIIVHDATYKSKGYINAFVSAASDAAVISAVNTAYAALPVVVDPETSEESHYASATALPSSFTLGTAAPTASYYLFDDTYASQGQFTVNATFAYDVMISDEMITAFGNTLISLGFSIVSHPQLGPGFLNTTTYEFVQFSASANELEIIVYLWAA